jgi:hypothetical protein
VPSSMTPIAFSEIILSPYASVFRSKLLVRLAGMHLSDTDSS